MTTYRLGVDIGGTFTDIVLLGEDGAVATKKILSTPDDYSRAIEDGIRQLLAETGIRPADIAEVAHGTTVATNAIIERKGVRVALVTTEGFRDVLEIARYRAPHLYDVFFRKPEPLVERRLRFQVPERIAASGAVVLPLDRKAVLAVAEKCVAAKVDAVAICFINAYANGAHEEEAAAIFRQHHPDLPVTVSSELVPQIQEYERTSTAVVNAYIRPVIERYARRLDDRLKTLGIRVPLNIMQSNGGVLPGALAAQKPIFIIESGPAAGVVGATRLGERLGLGDAIVFDMGGTTAKASIIVGGQYGTAPETEVGGGASLGHRMVKGGGYVVQAPTIDIAEVGAGGGSIAWIDAAGGIQVGPHSAGAAPGPVCYGSGGTEPTVTDANLLLGYLNPDVLVGGDLRLDRAGAEKAVAAIGARLGQQATETAYGIHLIANARMMRALSAVSSERGLDPAGFGIFAFGGNGGVHVCGLADSLGIGRVVVPPAAGLFSALGLIFADVEHQCIRAYYRPIDSLDLDDLNKVFGALSDEAVELLTADGYATDRQELTYTAEVKYVGQNTALPIPVAALPIARGDLADISERFAVAHQNVFGYRSDAERLQLATLKAVGRGIPDAPRLPKEIKLGDGYAPKGGTRRAYFGKDVGWLDTPVTSRAALGKKPRPGPIVVEEYDSTTVVRPGWSASLDGWNNIVLVKGAG